MPYNGGSLIHKNHGNHIQIEFLSIDFSKPTSDYLTKLQEKLHETRNDGSKIADSIAVLINCVGYLPYAYDTFYSDGLRRENEFKAELAKRKHLHAQNHELEDFEEPAKFQYSEKVEQSLNINCLSQLVMTSEIIKLMRNKKMDIANTKNQYKGVIISMSSYTGMSPMPYWATYSACKGFNYFFSDALARETIWTTNDIIFQTQHPMEIATKMAPTELPSLRSPTPEKYVESALKTVGWMHHCCGYWYHEFRMVLSYIGGEKFGVDFVQYGRYQRITAGRLRKTKQSNLAHYMKLKTQVSRTFSDSLTKAFGREEAANRKYLEKKKRFFF